MKKENVFLIIAVILVFGTLIFTLLNFFGSADTRNANSATANAILNFGAVITGTTDQGDVAIELTPKKITDGKLEVDIGVNTHSADLSQFDLKEITTLAYSGRDFKPISAPTLSGHHNYGTLVFDLGSGIEKIDDFRRTIIGIPQFNERVFKW